MKKFLPSYYNSYYYYYCTSILILFSTAIISTPVERYQRKLSNITNKIGNSKMSIFNLSKKPIRTGDCGCKRSTSHYLYGLFSARIQLKFPNLENCSTEKLEKQQLYKRQPCVSAVHLRTNNGKVIYLEKTNALDRIQTPSTIVIYDGNSTDRSPVIFIYPCTENAYGYMFSRNCSSQLLKRSIVSSGSALTVLFVDTSSCSLNITLDTPSLTFRAGHSSSMTKCYPAEYYMNKVTSTAVIAKDFWIYPFRCQWKLHTYQSRKLHLHIKEFRAYLGRVRVKFGSNDQNDTKSCTSNDMAAALCDGTSVQNHLSIELDQKHGEAHFSAEIRDTFQSEIGPIARFADITFLVEYSHGMDRINVQGLLMTFIDQLYVGDSANNHISCLAFDKRGARLLFGLNQANRTEDQYWALFESFNRLTMAEGPSLCSEILISRALQDVSKLPIDASRSQYLVILTSSCILDDKDAKREIELLQRLNYSVSGVDLSEAPLSGPRLNLTALISDVYTWQTIAVFSAKVLHAIQLSSKNVSSSTTVTNIPRTSTINTTILTSTQCPVTRRSRDEVISDHLNEILDDISQHSLSKYNVTAVLNDLNETVASNVSVISPKSIFLISKILDLTSQVAGLSLYDFTSFSTTIDNLLFVEERKFEDADKMDVYTTKRILKSITKMATNCPEDASYLNGTNLGLLAKSIICRLIPGYEGEEGFADTGSDFMPTRKLAHESLMAAAEGSDKKRDFYRQFVAAISIPRNILCSAHRVLYSIFRSQKLFTMAEKKRQKRTLSEKTENEKNDTDFCQYRNRISPSPVLSATLMLRRNLSETSNSFGREFKSISSADNFGTRMTMAVVHYSLKSKPQPLHGSYETAFWTGEDWSSHGCKSLYTDSEYYAGECSHLTDFALVVSGVTKYPALCDTFLKTLGYILSSMSTITLLILLGIFTAASIPTVNNIPLLKTLTTSGPSGVLGLPYLATLFAYFFLFTLLTDRTVLDASTESCAVFAAILYTLLISVILWTVCQGMEIVRKFYTFTRTGKSLEKITKITNSAPICILFPIILTIILRYTVEDFFNRDDCFCWIRPDYVISAVILPGSLFVVADLVCTAIILHQFYCNNYMDKNHWTMAAGKNRGGYGGHSRTIQSKMARRRQGVQKTIVVLSMQVILGAPWILQYFTVSSGTLTVWHYLFTIFNGSQGIALGCLYALIRFNRNRGLRRFKEDTTGPLTLNAGLQKQKQKNKHFISSTQNGLY